MDTFTNSQPTTHEPVPARDDREAPSRLRVLATTLAVAGLTATGGLAVILSTGATGGGATAVGGGVPAAQIPMTPQRGAATAVPAATAAAATAAPAATQQTTTAAQPPQPAQGNGPGHASSGGS